MIHDERVQDGFQLFELLSEKDELFQMRETFPNQVLVEATLEVIDNLIDDGLVISKRYATVDGTLYQIKGLSTSEHSYLLALKEPSLKDKVIDFLKSDGLPITPQAVIKAIARLTL